MKEDDLRISTITRIDPRRAWQSEPYDFTPWLAQEQNFSALADALHFFDAEVEAVEFSVGDFSADIVGKDRDGLILIENQLEQTDHKHLGQILTYVAGLDGSVKVVWISTKVREEHRAAIDWLNSSTNDSYSFFAVELELIRIADSPLAPLFHVVAKPNFWSRHANSQAQIAANISNPERAEKYEAFWLGLAKLMDTKNPHFRGSNPPKGHWWQFPTGRTGFSIILTAGGRDHYAGVELYIHSDEDKFHFDALMKMRDEIEVILGTELEWERLNGKKGSRIVRRRRGIDPFNTQTQGELYEWYWSELCRFRDAFIPLIRTLSL